MQRWLELFHRLTVDIYRVRHSNLRIAFEELVAVAALSEEHGAELNHLRDVSDVSAELLKILKQDPVGSEILPSNVHYYPLLERCLDSSSKIIQPGLVVLSEQACGMLRNHYRPALLRNLRAAIMDNQIERALSLTSALATDLVSEGYDMRHLYWRGEWAFTRMPRRAFMERVDSFLEPFHERVSDSYSIVTRLIFSSPSSATRFPATIGEVSITEEVDGVTDPISEGYSKRDPLFRYASCRVVATDPFSATRRGHVVLSKSLDLLQFSQPSVKVDTNNGSLVITETGRKGQTVPNGLELLGPIRLVREDLDDRVAQINRIKQNTQIDEMTRTRLTLGLMYFRRGLNDVTPQGQFLNYWIGLEALAGGKPRTDVGVLRQNVSKTATLSYLRHVLLDLHENLRRLRVVFPPELHDLVKLWQWIVDERKREALISAAVDAPLLQHRIKDLGTKLSSRSSLKLILETHAQDVSWHVQRLSRLRNSIVHGGNIPEDFTQLAAHLADYLWRVVRDLLDELGAPNGVRDLRKHFEKNAYLYTRVSQIVNESSADPLPYDVLINPRGIWPVRAGPG